MAGENEHSRIDDDVDKRLNSHSLGKSEQDSASGAGTGAQGVSDARNQESFGFNAKGDEKNDSSSLFNANDKNKKGRFRGAIRRNPKKSVLAGTGIGAGMMAALAIFFLAVPLKIEHMVSNLQNRFFASSEQASEDAIDKMTIKYFKKHVLPDYKNCGSTISKDCKVRIVGGDNNPVTNLYSSWASVKLENTMATKYNFEITYNKKSSSWKVKAPGVENPDGIDLGRDGENIDSVFTSRQEVRKAVRQSVENETKWKNVYYRFKVGGLLEQKYGIKRCMVFCGKRDQFADKKDQKKNAAKILITQRVIAPRTETLGIVMGCLFDPNCDPNKTTTNGSETNGGEPTSDVENEVRSTRAQRVPEFGSSDPEKVDKMIKDYNTISEKGYTGYAINKVLTKIGLEQFSDKATASVPIIGLVDTFAKLNTSLANAGPKVKKLSYLTNSGAAVAMFSAYRTYGDEIHTGKVDATEIGSFSDSLSPGNRGAKTDPIKGGTASAESSPLYASVINGKQYSSGPHKSIVDNILPTTAYAATKDQNTQSSDYKCADNKSLDGLVCPEEKLGTGNKTLDSISDFLNSPGMNVVTKVSGAITTLTKPINDLFGSVANFVIGLVPGFGTIEKIITDAFGGMFESLSRKLIPDPFGTNMSGARTFNMMAAGANVAGNDACTAIGCSTVTSAQAAATVNRYQAEEKSDFESQPMFARMFDTDSSYSLVSRLAMAVPLNTYSSGRNGAMAAIMNPISAVANGFGSMFSGGHAFAATGEDSVDPFNLGSVGFPENEIPSDPEAYWEINNCGDTSENGPIAQWEKAAASENGGTTNPDTGMPIHTTTNACKLISVAVGNAGGRFNTDLMDDTSKQVLEGGTSSGGSASSSDSSSNVAIDGEAKDLAKQILDAGNLTGDPRYMSQIEAVSKGDYSCNVNPGILKMLVGVTVNGKHKIYMSSLNRKCTGVLTASGVKSFHYTESGGHAIDITSYDGKPTNGGDAASKAYLEEASKYLPKKTGYGQDNCNSGFSYPNGSYHFYDTCNHQHLQVPVEQDK